MIVFDSNRLTYNVAPGPVSSLGFRGPVVNLSKAQCTLCVTRSASSTHALIRSNTDHAREDKRGPPLSLARKIRNKVMQMFPVLLRCNDTSFAVREMIDIPQTPYWCHKNRRHLTNSPWWRCELISLQNAQSRPSQLTVRRVSPNCVGSYSGPSASCGRTPPLEQRVLSKAKENFSRSFRTVRHQRPFAVHFFRYCSDIFHHPCYPLIS